MSTTPRIILAMSRSFPVLRLDRVCIQSSPLCLDIRVTCALALWVCPSPAPPRTAERPPHRDALFVRRDHPIHPTRKPLTKVNTTERGRTTVKRCALSTTRQHANKLQNKNCLTNPKPKTITGSRPCSMEKIEWYGCVNPPGYFIFLRIVTRARNKTPRLSFTVQPETHSEVIPASRKIEFELSNKRKKRSDDELSKKKRVNNSSERDKTSGGFEGPQTFFGSFSHLFISISLHFLWILSFVLSSLVFSSLLSSLFSLLSSLLSPLSSLLSPLSSVLCPLSSLVSSPLLPCFVLSRFLFRLALSLLFRLLSLSLSSFSVFSLCLLSLSSLCPSLRVTLCAMLCFVVCVVVVVVCVCGVVWHAENTRVYRHHAHMC